MKLREFVASDLRNAWCAEGAMEIYVRRGRRLVRDEWVNSFDVASASSRKPGSKRFPKIMDEVEALARENGFSGVFIENVLNERLCPFFEQRGYIMVSHDGYTPCYWLAV